MKRICILLAVAVALFSAPHAFAKAYYADKTNMIQKAEVIVVVNITKVEVVEKKPEKGWTYRQKATAQVEQSIKGGLSGQIEIFGMEDFICARCEYKTGRFLLFLTKGNAGFWHGANWHLGIRPVSEDKAEWFNDDKLRFDMTKQPLVDVIKEIEAIIEQKAPNQVPEDTARKLADPQR